MLCLYSLLAFFYPLPMMMEYSRSLVLALCYFHFIYGIWHLKRKRRNSLLKRIRNDRKQRLGDYDSFKKTYVDFYNFIYKKTLEKTITHPIWVELINNEYSPSKKDDFYLVLSKNLSALCQDGLKYCDFEVPENCDELEKSFSEMLKFFITRKTFKEIRRFRKVIPVERFAKLSEMLYEISKKTESKLLPVNCQLVGILFKFDLYKHQEKTHLLWWALRMCSVAVRLAPPLGLEPRTL